MKSNTLIFLIVAGIFSLPVSAQMPEGYLDIDVVHVKMGKRLDFDAINKRMAQMNRKDGDHWQAFEVVYGDSNAVYFVSPRATLAAAGDGLQTFDDAVRKAVGDAGMHKLFNDFDAAADSEHESIYRRRWDLSANAPMDAGAYNKMVGEARWLRLVTVYTRPGKGDAFEAELKANKEAQERSNPGIPFIVSASVAGAAPGTFRIATLVKSMGDMDKVKSVAEVRGNSYESFLKTEQEAVQRVDIIIGRYLPELSNPPDEIVAVSPSYWRPKAEPAAPAKSKTPAKQ